MEILKNFLAGLGVLFLALVLAGISILFLPLILVTGSLILVSLKLLLYAGFCVCLIIFAGYLVRKAFQGRSEKKQ